MQELKGVIVATVTPFTAGGAEVEANWIPQHLKFLEERGADGVLIMGTNGEGPSLTVGERKRIIDVAMSSRGRLGVMVGTGCAALPDTIEVSRYAAEAGADCVLIVPPFYFKNLAPEGLLGYYRAVLRALPATAKVALYNIPSYSGVEITDHLVAGLSQEFPEQLLGIKDTSGRLEQTQHYLATFPNLRTFTGSDELVAAAVKAGSAGAISAVGNVFPELLTAVFAAHQSGGDVDAAQARLSKMRAALKKYPSHSALKNLLHSLMGLPLTHVRPPLAELTPAEAEAFKDEVTALMRQG